jgi:hypothetical protein
MFLAQYCFRHPDRLRGLGHVMHPKNLDPGLDGETGTRK